jgi:hypothetical protein
MQDIFKFHDNIIDNFSLFSRSFTKIRASDIKKVVDAGYSRYCIWRFATLHSDGRCRFSIGEQP